MTRDGIDDLMRDNGIVVVGEAVYALCQIVAAREREACAKVCDNRITNEAGMQREDYENRQCAAAIRARGMADETIANVRLIAAAPDLLLALNQVMSWIDNWSPEFVNDEEWPADRDKVRAAIAKATEKEK